MANQYVKDWIVKCKEASAPGSDGSGADVAQWSAYAVSKGYNHRDSAHHQVATAFPHLSVSGVILQPTGEELRRSKELLTKLLDEDRKL